MLHTTATEDYENRMKKTSANQVLEELQMDRIEKFNTFEIVLMIIFGSIIVFINIYCNFFIKLSEDWSNFSFAGSVYFFRSFDLA